MKTSFDLNLLRLLVALDKYQTLDGVTKQLMISRATFARGLARLRAQFDNELFVAHHGRYETTAFTRDLLSRVSPALTELDTVVHQSSRGSFSELSGIFSVFIPAFMPDTLAVELQAEVLALGSPLRMELLDWPGASELSLSADAPNIGVMFYPQALSQQYVQHKIGTMPLGIYCRPTHPLAELELVPFERLFSEGFVRYRHLTSQPPPMLSAWLTEAKTELNACAAVNSSSAALRYVKEFGFLAMGDPCDELYQHYGLCWRPVVDGRKRLSYDYGFCYHRAWYQHPLMREIETMLKTIHQRMLTLSHKRAAGYHQP